MRDKRPYIKPVTRIELNTGNEKMRWIAAGILLLVGIAAIAFGFSQALNVQPGWTEIIANTQEVSCAPDFKLMYDFSETGGSAASVNKALIQCYSDTAVRAQKVFSADMEELGLANMAYLNHHVNEPVTVDPDLYHALEKVAASGNRQIYLAPAWVEYNRIFLCENDSEAAIYDPNRNDDVKAWLQELSFFVNDPNHISVKILDNGMVELLVSEDYLSFAQGYGIEAFVDFGWMRNAFAADLIADSLISAGFTKGYLASFDGFTRNLDESGTVYSQNIFDRKGTDVYLPARMQYNGSYSIVTLRDYPMTDHDRWHYYAFEDGKTVSVFLDPSDCMDKTAAANLTAYSQEAGCADILLSVTDLFIAGQLPESELIALKEKGIWSIWPRGNTLCYNDPDLNLEMLADTGLQYDKKLQ